MKNFYTKYKRQILTLITLFSPLFWYIIGIMFGSGGGIITICIISGLLTGGYGIVRVIYEWDLYLKEQNKNI